jgi:iron-only hydrogenase group A
MEDLRPFLKKYQKKGQCLPESAIQKISKESNIPVEEIYKKVSYSPYTKEEDHYSAVLELLKNKEKHIVVETAPSVRVSIGEEFGLQPGTDVTGKLAAALRKCGFNKVFDTPLGADIVVVEEASELIERIKNKGKFPIITTCCPAWIKFMEHFFHELIPHMSTCKSPHEMLGVLSKKYYGKKAGIDHKKIAVVSIMPCTAKRFESQRPELKSGVDYVLTAVEAANLIKHFKIDFVKLKDEPYDAALGIASGAGTIFGATGGVMEAAVRTAYELAEKKPFGNLEFREVRGMQGIKEAKLKILGKELRCAVANGLNNARILLKNYKNYDFIEVMSCPGGCVGGGGQPQPWTEEKIKKRIEGLYKRDSGMKIRKAHENPLVKKIYDEFLKRPLSTEAKRLLHTHFTPKKF